MQTPHPISFTELYDYFLDQSERQAALATEAHLATCLPCRHMLRMMALLTGATVEEVSPTGSHIP